MQQSQENKKYPQNKFQEEITDNEEHHNLCMEGQRQNVRGVRLHYNMCARRTGNLPASALMKVTTEKDSKSTPDEMFCKFGCHTFVPVSWACKEQTAVSLPPKPLTSAPLRFLPPLHPCPHRLRDPSSIDSVRLSVSAFILTLHPLTSSSSSRPQLQPRHHSRARDRPGAFNPFAHTFTWHFTASDFRVQSVFVGTVSKLC